MFLFSNLALAIFTSVAWSVPTKKPNIVVIMADDLGYADVGYNTFQKTGTSDVVTPNIDTIRRDGASFPTGYVTGNICAVSRMGMLTGRYQNRLGCYSGDPTGEATIPMTTSVYGTIASRLQEAGYKTFMAGKWHTGANPQVDGNGPASCGFDEAWYFMGGKSPYFFTDANYPYPSPSATDPQIYYNHTLLKPDGSYTSDFWTNRAREFMKLNAAKPFFLYLAYNAVHNDLHWPDNEADKTHTRREMIVAMGKRMDENIGYVINELKTLGLYDNTLIFFLSDNGGVYGDYNNPKNMISDNRPLFEGKHYSYEGGIRVPFLVSWPSGGIQRNSTVLSPVISLDIMPTALAAAGVKKVTDLDGSNLLPLLTQGKSLPSRVMFWSGGSDKADNSWSDGDEAWSVVRSPDNFKLLIHRCEMFLYDLNDKTNGETELQSLNLDLDVNKAKQIDLYRQLIQWHMQMPKVIGDDAISWDPDHPRYKDNWSFFLPMTPSPMIVNDNILEAVEMQVALGGSYQPYVVARYSKGNHASVYPEDEQPSTAPGAAIPLKWSLISTIGGSIDSLTGKFTAGTKNGYVILKASATFNRLLGRQPEDFSSYQLLKVGNGGVQEIVLYDKWAEDHTLRGGSALKGEDPDGDGANNLYEYALGGDPTESSDGSLLFPVLQSATGDKLEYVYSRRKDAVRRGLTYSIETTTDLQSGIWNNIGTSAETGSVSKNAEFDTVTNLISIDGKKKLFVRLKVSSKY